MVAKDTKSAGGIRCLRPWRTWRLGGSSHQSRLPVCESSV